VEDEETMGVGLEYNLSEEGYVVSWAKDGREALVYFESHDFDLIILDIMLPYYDGFEIAKIIREKSSQIPILMLTAKSAIKDRLRGLETGGDDYLTKPFHLKELLLRINGMLKRKSWYKSFSKTPPLIRFGENEINFENLAAKRGEEVFRLTPREAMIMKYLIDRKGRIVSREELLENVWNVSSKMETRTVDNFIVRLRKYFEPSPSDPIYIKSIRSAGYMFSD
jgi:DNA-binding response OmpR family regulator